LISSTTMNNVSPDDLQLSNEDDPHFFLENDGRKNKVVQPIVSELNNMPMEIEQLESTNMLLLGQLNHYIGGVTVMKIKVAGRMVPFQSWHYKREDPVLPKINKRFEYMDFQWLKERSELYRWQRVAAITIKSLNNDCERYKQRLYFSHCA